MICIWLLGNSMGASYDPLSNLVFAYLWLSNYYTIFFSIGTFLSTSVSQD